MVSRGVHWRGAYDRYCERHRRNHPNAPVPTRPVVHGVLPGQSRRLQCSTQACSVLPEGSGCE
ncbi:YbdD/YjiX family protein [Streptomyces sp. NBC_00322]|uniref:CstA-like transporter-associated (seleno)protein n=1 Tax=Streptomyces sp. NBC_00322 TaxID=2975712 RepID=UPI002E2E3E56|nr:CstA-like transporter-associated (seleno)protein [Streptomyces sp. NBC_00322]